MHPFTTNGSSWSGLFARKSIVIHSSSQVSVFGLLVSQLLPVQETHCWVASTEAGITQIRAAITKNTFMARVESLSVNKREIVVLTEGYSRPGTLSGRQRLNKRTSCSGETGFHWLLSKQQKSKTEVKNPGGRIRPSTLARNINQSATVVSCGYESFRDCLKLAG